MAPDFDPWHRRRQNSSHTTRRSYSTLSEFYSNIRLETGPSKVSHKGFYISEELVQKPLEEQKI